MSFLDTVDIVDLQSINLDQVIVASNGSSLFDLSRLFEKLSQEAKEDNEIRSVSYKFLSCLCSIHLRADNIAQPFSPMFCGPNGRSILPSDLNKELLSAVRHLAINSSHPVLKAFFADIVWSTNKRDHEIGRIAASSYLQAVRDVEAQKLQPMLKDERFCSPECLDFLRRAFVIFTSLGRDKPELSEAKSFLKELLDKQERSDDCMGYVRLAKIAHKYDVVESGNLAKSIEEKADELFVAGNYIIAHDLFKLSADYYGRNTGADSFPRCMNKAVDSLVSLCGTEIPAMNKASWLRDCISILRNVPGSQARQAEIKDLLAKIQPEIANELGQFQSRINITDLVEKAQNAVENTTLVDALLIFSCLSHSPDLDALNTQALETLENSPLLGMMGGNVVDAEGRVLHSFKAIDANDNAADLTRIIMQNEAFRRQMLVAGYVEPARQVITAQNPVESIDLMPLVRESPFIPNDRVRTFSQAFSALFSGDYLSCAYMLFPQLENCLRHLLQLQGIDPTSFKQNMTQLDVTLSVLLSNFREQLEQVLGREIVADIERIFDHPAGPKLRHNLAHGILGDNVAWSHDLIYGCWLILHISFLPLQEHKDALQNMYRFRS